MNSFKENDTFIPVSFAVLVLQEGEAFKPNLRFKLDVNEILFNYGFYNNRCKNDNDYLNRIILCVIFHGSTARHRSGVAQKNPKQREIMENGRLILYVGSGNIR